ncbi:MAG: 2,3-bisphosphoglycerate-independent phosphoglycerate mutase [Thermodesulfovibrionales bacterium]
MMHALIRPLLQKNQTKIVLVVMDGLGGLPVDGRTELEAANTPNLDSLAQKSACGLHYPVEVGITPGSGPGHLSLFGYDPLDHQIGRGILEALGLGMDVRKTDVCLRCNYATIRDGLIADRRAGRIHTDDSRPLTLRLQEAIRKIDDVEVFFAPGMEHRFAVIFRFPSTLAADAAAVNDTDPQQEGKPPLEPVAGSDSARPVARIAAKFIKEASAVLAEEQRANFLLLRGFSVMPDLLSFGDVYGLNPLAIANYPMYRGIAKLVGMAAPDLSGTVRDEIDFLKANYGGYDFFFLHVKKVDSYGEDGNFAEKSHQIEQFDHLLPEIIGLKPDVLIVTGDHSTPATMKGHSWHPVPVLLHSPYVLGGLSSAFSERECFRGELGLFKTTRLMPLALANAGRLKKFGA